MRCMRRLVLPIALFVLVLVGCAGGGTSTTGGGGSSGGTPENPGEYHGGYQRERYHGSGWAHVSSGDVHVTISPSGATHLDFSNDPDMDGTTEAEGQFNGTYGSFPSQGFIHYPGFWWLFNVYFEYGTPNPSRFTMILRKN